MSFTSYRYNDTIGIVEHLKSYNANKSLGNFAEAMKYDRQEYLSLTEWKQLTTRETLNGFLRSPRFKV